MPITSDEILFQYSNSSATNGNSDSLNPTTPANAATFCLGKYMSSAQWFGGVNDLFPNISGTNNADFAVDYRCLFVYNSDPSLILYDAIVWVYSLTNPGATINLAADLNPASPIGSSSQQAAIVPTANSGPSGLTFLSATSKSMGVYLGNIPANYCAPFWIQRIASNTNPITSDSLTIRVEGSTSG